MLPGLGYAPDLRERVARYLHEVPLDAFLAEARTLLSARQKHAIALHLLDAHLAAGAPTERAALLQCLLSGIGVDPAELAAHQLTLALKNDLTLFPQ